MKLHRKWHKNYDLAPYETRVYIIALKKVERKYEVGMVGKADSAILDKGMLPVIIYAYNYGSGYNTAPSDSGIKNHGNHYCF